MPRGVELLERDEAGRGADGTQVELDLRIDPGDGVPRCPRRAISDAVVRRALRDPKAFVER